MGWQDLISPITGGLLGTGGLVALYKARHEARTSLSESEAKFRQDILKELEDVQTENKALWVRINEQSKESYLRDEQVMLLAATVDRYQVVQTERDMALRRLERCEIKAERDRLTYEKRIAELEQALAELKHQLEELTRKVEIDE